jgi:hypothetical protein
MNFFIQKKKKEKEKKKIAAEVNKTEQSGKFTKSKVGSSKNIHKNGKLSARLTTEKKERRLKLLKSEIKVRTSLLNLQT